MEALRAEFPVLQRLSYLNAGTCGPIPAKALAAAGEELATQAELGRGDDAFFRGRMLPLKEQLCARAAAIIGSTPDQTALTHSTTDGVNVVLSSLELGPGDEVLTSDEEHPGVTAPLAVGRRRRGYEVRVVPFTELANEVRPQTRLVATSHVSWVNGLIVDHAALAATDALVLLDGAQGIGAVPVDVSELGCEFYACSGQKWACGPAGLGYLHVREDLCADLPPTIASYGTLVEPSAGLESEFHPNARRFDTGFIPPEHSAWALASFDVLEGPGLEAVQSRAIGLAADLAEKLAEAGLTVAPRGDSTLISWEAEDPEAEAKRLRAEGIVVRWLPETPYVRASVGAWSSEDELERLVISAS